MIPAEAGFHAAEISAKGDKELLLRQYPELQKMILLLDSGRPLSGLAEGTRAVAGFAGKNAPVFSRRPEWENTGKMGKIGNKFT